MIGKLLTLIFLSFSLISGSCASHTAFYSVIEPGDNGKVVTKDNEETSFVVVAVTDDAILGESNMVHLAKISKLQKERVSGTKNFWLVNDTVGEDLWMDGWVV